LTMKAGKIATMFNPWSLALGTLAMAGVAATRLASGKPLEGTAADLNKIMLGDMDEEARAHRQTRNMMAGDQAIAHIYVEHGKGEIEELYEHHYDLNLRREKSRTKFNEAFPVDSTLDMLIIRARDVFLRLWNGGEGPEKADRLAGKLSAAAEERRGGAR